LFSSVKSDHPELITVSSSILKKAKANLSTSVVSIVGLTGLVPCETAAPVASSKGVPVVTAPLNLCITP
jgi:hypothetical protein